MTKQKLMILISAAILVTIAAVIGVVKSMKSSEPVDPNAVTDQSPESSPAPKDPESDAPVTPTPNETTAVDSTVDSSVDSANDSSTVSSTDATTQTTPPKKEEPKLGAGTQGTTPSFSDDESKTAKLGKIDPPKKVKEPVAPAKPNCFAAEYRHTKKMQAEDIEEFLDYTNAYPLAAAGATPDTGLNPATVCVKVNGQVIKHKIIQNKGVAEALIGPVVGPESVIRVSYCVGKKSNCGEPCVAKQKRFMDDMMSDAEGDADFKDSPDLQTKVKELRTAASQSEELSKQSVMRTWDTIKSQDWTCKKGK